LASYNVPRRGSVKGYTKELGIHLVSIPSDANDELQPLDRAVFATVEAMWRESSRKHVAGDPMMVVNHQIVVQFLTRSWEQIHPSILTRARSLDLGPEEEEEELNGTNLDIIPLFITSVHSIAWQRPSATRLRG
jgi:hypothetical protein